MRLPPCGHLVDALTNAFSWLTTAVKASGLFSRIVSLQMHSRDALWSVSSLHKYILHKESFLQTNAHPMQDEHLSHPFETDSTISFTHAERYGHCVNSIKQRGTR